MEELEPPVPELLDSESSPGGHDSSTGVSNKQTEASKEFSEVRMKRKRKAKGAEMEVDQPVEESSVAKRPSFPPVDASTPLVSYGQKCINVREGV